MVSTGRYHRPGSGAVAVRRPLRALPPAPGDAGSDLDARAAVTWLVAVVTIIYLGVRGGGYDTAIWGSVGVIVGWAALLGVLLALPRARRPGPAGEVMLIALGLLVVWSALGMIWTLSGERTLAAVARDVTYLLVFAFALGAVRARQGRFLLAGVATAISVIAVLALLSRLHPGWFGANATDALLPQVRSRLSYPLNYWNALAELIALGLALVLALAVHARTMAAQALASAMLPMLGLTVALTLSRGGLIALALAVIVYLVLTPERLFALLIVAVGALGAGLLTAVAFGDHDLHQGLSTPTATSQGTTLLVLTVVVCLAAGTFPLVLAGLRRRRAMAGPVYPGPVTEAVRAHPRVLAGAVVLVLAVVFVVVGGPGRVSHAWTSFQRPTITQNLTPARLGSLSGNGRYQFWKASLSAVGHQPLHGIGSGTWEFWWTRHGDVRAGYAQNAHSLLFETLAETGVPGGLLIVVFLVAALAGMVKLTREAEVPAQPWLAAVAAAAVAFTVAALSDWVWQVPVVPVCFLLLVGAALGEERPWPSGPAGLATRLAAGIAVAAGLVVIAVSLEATLAIQDSQSAASRGALASALGYARTAEQVEPYGASPWLQEALVLERVGALRGAQRAALHAQRNEPANWRLPVILARIDAELGDTRAAVAASRRALVLNPGVALAAP